METPTQDFKDEMTKLDQVIDQVDDQLGFKPRLTTKLYPSAYLFHRVTAFQITDQAKKLIPFAYDDGHNLTEDGYVTRYLGRKDPDAIKSVKKYQQNPSSLKLNLQLDSSVVKDFASRLFTIEDVRYSEINLNTDGDTTQQLALDIVMFAELLNHVLTNRK